MANRGDNMRLIDYNSENEFGCDEIKQKLFICGSLKEEKSSNNAIDRSAPCCSIVKEACRVYLM